MFNSRVDSRLSESLPGFRRLWLQKLKGKEIIRLVVSSPMYLVGENVNYIIAI